MKAKHNIFEVLEISLIIIGAIIVCGSLMPGILKMYFSKIFTFDVANFFLFGFLIGAGIMVVSFILFEYLDEKTTNYKSIYY